MGMEGDSFLLTCSVSCLTFENQFPDLFGLMNSLVKPKGWKSQAKCFLLGFDRE